MPELPAHYQWFSKAYPRAAERCEQLQDACLTDGPLGAKDAALIKLGIATGAGLEGAVHAHVRLARAAGAAPEEVRHAVLLATTTVGFPRMMAAMSWVNDVIEKE